MTHALITAPSGEALSLSEVKAHLRLDTSDEDTLLSSLIATAREHLEATTGLSLMTQTWRLYLDDWPQSGIVELKKSPVQAVTAIHIFDDNGDEEPVSPLPPLDPVSRPARLMVRDMARPGQSLNGIEIDYRTGFGDSALEVPDSLKRAMLTHIALMFELRGAVSTNMQPGGIPDGYERLLAPFIMRGL